MPFRHKKACDISIGHKAGKEGKIDVWDRKKSMHLFYDRKRRVKAMKKRLVAYFSASGITKKVAEAVAESAKADLVEIAPKVPYTREDLNWMDKKSRSSVEMGDKKFRPELQDAAIDMNQYDEIIMGFPIWWYVAPTIVNTFLEKRIWKYSKRIAALRTRCNDCRRKDIESCVKRGNS